MNSWTGLCVSFILYCQLVSGLLKLEPKNVFAPSVNPKSLYFVVCTLVKNEGKYLREWVEFHSILGVDHFLIFDDESDDNSSSIIQPYVSKGIVTFLSASSYFSDCGHYSNDPNVRHVQNFCQRTAFTEAINFYRSFTGTKWLGVFDVDEFLYPIGTANKAFESYSTEEKKQLKSHLSIYDNLYDVVCFKSAVFGGRNRSEGLVIEDYTRRAPLVETNEKWSFLNFGHKCVGDVNKVDRSVVHSFDCWKCHYLFLEPDDKSLVMNHYQYKTFAEQDMKAVVNRNPFVAYDPDKTLFFTRENDSRILYYLPYLKFSLGITNTTLSKGINVLAKSISSSPRVESLFILPTKNNCSTYYEGQATVVTSFYSLSSSKHSSSAYDEWISNFMQLAFPVVVFVNNQSLIQLTAKYPPNNHRIYVIREIDDFVTSQFDFSHSLALDPEISKGHSIELYKIWNEKPFMVADVIKKNPFGTKGFVWTDIGSFRSSAHLKYFSGYPDSSTFDLAFVSFNEIVPFEDEDFVNPFHLDFRFMSKIRLMGGFFAGGSQPLLKFSAIHLQLLVDASQAGIFFGKDQDLFAFAAIRHPDLIQLIPKDVMQLKYLSFQYDGWFLSHFHWASLPHKIYCITTLVLSVESAVGANVILSTLQKYSDSYVLQNANFVVILISGSIENIDIMKKLDVKWDIKFVERLSPISIKHSFQRLKGRMEQFSKLIMWSWVDYMRVLYLSVDTMVVGNLSPMLTNANLSIAAVPVWSKVNGSHEFDTSVISLRPNLTEFHYLLEEKESLARISQDFSEKVFLNKLYKDKYEVWPFTYNYDVLVKLEDSASWDDFKNSTVVLRYAKLRPFEIDADVLKSIPLLERWFEEKSHSYSADST